MTDNDRAKMLYELYGELCKEGLIMSTIEETIKVYPRLEDKLMGAHSIAFAKKMEAKIAIDDILYLNNTEKNDE